MTTEHKFVDQLDENVFVVTFFPTVVYKTKLLRKFTEDELTVCKFNSENTIPGSGNRHTKNDKILHHPMMKDLKKYVEDSANDYVKRIMSPRTDFELYVTISWLNFADEGESHELHYHSNSILSGVLYLNAFEGVDKIYFDRNNQREIHIDKNPNFYNSNRFGVSVDTGDLLLFDSKLLHSVEKVIVPNHTRISLAFNTWFKGEIGDHQSLTKLIL